ncbi:MAG: hypothetical protein ACOYL6_14725 [Bacteriovoracaceae bacterium]
MKRMFLVILIILANISFAQDFPKSPNSRFTPGSVCDQPTQYRYPEHIAYCERNVDTLTKDEVFNTYRTLGYKLPPNQRSSYKIDHYIPLCAGGSNDANNLWPQHVTIYKLTDPIEPLGCQKMSEGKLSQKEFIDLIKQAKNDLSQVPVVLETLRNL